MILIMFDIDGTLTESYACDQQAYADAFFDVTGCRGVSTDWHSYDHVTSHGITAQAIRHHMGREAEAVDVLAVEQAMLLRLQMLYQQNPRLFCEVAGASAFLDYLCGMDDVAIAIATGCWLSEARFKLSSCGLNVTDIPLASSEDGGSRTAIMTVAAERASRAAGGVVFERVIYFGDGPWDMAAAAALGYRFIGIGHGIERLRDAGVCYLHRDYSDISTLTRSLAAV